jgi:hypothetical protein
MRPCRDRKERALESGMGLAAAGMHPDTGCVTLAGWAVESGRAPAAGKRTGRLRFAFYGRVSTEDWQDPVTSRARQRATAEALVRGHGQVVAEFFDAGQSRTVAWARRPQAAALVAELTDPGRGWDAVVVGEYERAFCGSQYALMAPLFEHYGVQLWMPEAGGRVGAGRDRSDPSGRGGRTLGRQAGISAARGRFGWRCRRGDRPGRTRIPPLR